MIKPTVGSVKQQLQSKLKRLEFIVASVVYFYEKCLQSLELIFQVINVNMRLKENQIKVKEDHGFY